IEKVSKNTLLLSDLLYSEKFSARAPGNSPLKVGDMLQSFIIKNAQMHDINGLIRLAAREQKEVLLKNFLLRREAMKSLNQAFISANGSASIHFNDVETAKNNFSTFVSSFHNEQWAEQLGEPRLITLAEVPSTLFSGYALLSELNNFYLSSFYPLLERALTSSLDQVTARAIADIVASSESSVPFTTLKRLVNEREAEMVGFFSLLDEKLDNGKDLLKDICARRGHSPDYEPLPVFTREIGE
ncbi:MAG: hypothetical protein QXP70_03525, partial [Methanomassiliicoccales archaeon]